MTRSSLLVVAVGLGLAWGGWRASVPADSAPAGPPPQGRATAVTAEHRAGQTFVTWLEPGPAPPADATAQQISTLRTRLAESRLRYRIYRSATPIRALAAAAVVGEVPPLSVWDDAFYGVYPPPDARPPRFVIEDGGAPLPPGRGLFVYRAADTGPAYYAVVAVVGDRAATLDAGEATTTPVDETPGEGPPVLQRIEHPDQHQFVERPELRYYTRWESGDRSSVPGRPHDYLVGIPPGVKYPAPVGLHLHGWGGSLRDGHGWWYNAERGAILVSSNEQPYDWWTGYHERLGRQPLASPADWQAGVVRPYTQRRLLAFVDWLGSSLRLDRTRTFVAGNSMGGSGALMLAIRHPDRIAWAMSWVGVHEPRKSPTFRSSYQDVYGAPEWNVRFEDGTPVWDYFDDVWYLRAHPARDVGFLTFSNGKNDGAIGWEQAVDFLRALQETRQPHLFVWGQEGHGQRATMPAGGGERVNPLDLRVDQSLPAFTGSTLDDDPGDGRPETGAPTGQVNQYLTWKPDSIVDEPDRWGVEIAVIAGAPRDEAVVDVTPRRLQQFRVQPGETLIWTVTSGRRTIQEGQTAVDRLGLVTVPKVPVNRGGVMVSLRRPSHIP